MKETKDTSIAILLIVIIIIIASFFICSLKFQHEFNEQKRIYIDSTEAAHMTDTYNYQATIESKDLEIQKLLKK